MDLAQQVAKGGNQSETLTTQSGIILEIQAPHEIQESPQTEILVESTQIATHIDVDVEEKGETSTPPETIVEQPIQKCDNDILSTIFEWFTCDHWAYRNHRAVRLLKVCRRWRQVALQTPQLWRHFDVGLNRPMSSNLKQWDWLISLRPAAPDDICIDCRKGGFPDQPALADLWSRCNIPSLGRIRILEFLIPQSFVAARIPSVSIALPNTHINYLCIESNKHPELNNVQVSWEIDQLLEKFPLVQCLTLRRQSHFSLRPRNVFLHTTYLHIRDCVDVSIIPGLSSFVNLQRLKIKSAKILTGSEIPTTIRVQMPSLQWLYISQAPWFPWAQLDCPSLQMVAGEEYVSDSMIQFFKKHPHVRDIDIRVKEPMFASFVRAVPNVETLDLGGYIEGLIEWQTTTDLVDPPFPNLRQLILDRTKKEITLDLFESIVKTYCLPLKQSIHLTGEFNMRKTGVECLGVYATTESFKTAKWAQSSLLADCIQTSRLYPRSQFWICFEFRWPESKVCPP